TRRRSFLVPQLPFSRQPLLWARARFRTALAALPPEQRTLFVQRLRGESDVDGLAQALGIDARRARLALFHALRQMREDLSEADDVADDSAWLTRCRELVEDPSVVADHAPLATAKIRSAWSGADAPALRQLAAAPVPALVAVP